MGDWLAESIDECATPYDKARFAAGYAVVKHRCQAVHSVSGVQCDQTATHLDRCKAHRAT